MFLLYIYFLFLQKRLFETMENPSKLKQFARFYIVTHCYTLLLQKSIIQ